MRNFHRGNMHVRYFVASAVWALLAVALVALLDIPQGCKGFTLGAPVRGGCPGWRIGTNHRGSTAGILEARRRSPGSEVGATRAANIDGDTAAASQLAGGGGGGGGAGCTCRNCKGKFRRDTNTDDACSYHPGLFSGRLNRVNDVDTSGLEFFWSCCGEYDSKHPGCVRGRHFSYDDPPDGGPGGWRSPLTGTLRSE